MQRYISFWLFLCCVLCHDIRDLNFRNAQKRNLKLQPKFIFLRTVKCLNGSKMSNNFGGADIDLLDHFLRQLILKWKFYVFSKSDVKN